jgi:hypothetical protein
MEQPQSIDQGCLYCSALSRPRRPGFFRHPPVVRAQAIVGKDLPALQNFWTPALQPLLAIPTPCILVLHLFSIATDTFYANIRLI